MIIFLTGPSGVGKSTLRDYYCRIKKISPYPAFTTRPPRDGESEIHRTITEKDFFSLLSDKKLCLVGKNHGFYYGYPIEDLKNNNKSIYLFEVDSNTAIAERESLSAVIVRITASDSQRNIEIIREKRDDTEDRLTDYYRQQDENFLKYRQLSGDFLFTNNYDNHSLERFVDFIDHIIDNENRKQFLQ